MPNAVHPLAFGDTEGQPVACYDATHVAHGASQVREVPALIADTLEEIRHDYFDLRAGDPGAIVAVLVAPVRTDVDYGLVFVFADGPLGGCGEASMFAASLILGLGCEVRLETGAGVIVARPSRRGDITLTMPPGDARVNGADIDFDGHPVRVRTVSTGGNVFAAVSAADLAMEISPATALELTQRGAALLKSLRADAPGLPEPTMLLLTTPVSAARTTSAVIWGDAILNIGPCGTGTCARYILAVEDGDVAPGGPLAHVSPFDNAFTATSVASYLNGWPDGQIQVEIAGHVAVTAVATPRSNPPAAPARSRS